MTGVKFVKNDGGRAEAGFKGHTGDCAARAVAIVTGRPYKEIYDELAEFARRERPRAGKKRSHPRTGYQSRTLGSYLISLGFTWTPTMQVGSGCRVHVRRDELPPGRVILRLSKHYVASIERVVHDTSDPSWGYDGAEGGRCVYGYWTAP